MGSISPFARLLGQVRGEAFERLLLAHLRRSDGAAGFARGGAGAQAGAVAGAQAVLGRTGDDLRELSVSVSSLILANSRERARKLVHGVRS